MWKHRVSVNWLMARTHYLTASSIKSILPVTETGRKRSQAQIEANMMKVASNMMTAHIPNDDCISTGAAARGHLLEPIAIEEANNAKKLSLYHWDDVILVKGLLGWSPDAMSIPQDGGFDKRYIYNIDKKEPCPASIGEVKSYLMERHITSVYTDKKDCPERWQLAVGMALLRNCQYANLIFFNPDSTVRLAIKTYSRQDLEEEIKMVKEAEKSFQEFLESLPKIEEKNDFCMMNTELEKNSDYYMNKFMQEERMNI